MKAWTIAAALAVAGQVHAEPEPEAPTPWSKGVSAEDQAKANALVAEANQLFGQQSYTLALEKYSAALAAWDHPTIRLNMAVTLLRLDRILEADEALDGALRWGAAPFPTEKYEQTLDYKRLVDRQIATIDVSCTQHAVRIRFDSASWFACPGRQHRRVLAGEHTVVGEAQGFMTQSKSVVLVGGKSADVAIELLPIETVVKLEYPTRPWIPWTTAIAGAVVGLAGVPVWYSGRRQMDRFDQEFAAACTNRCESNLSQHGALRDEYDAAVFKGRAGVSMMVIGGATATAGVIWSLVFNRPRRVMPEIEPMPGGATAGASWRF